MRVGVKQMERLGGELGGHAELRVAVGGAR